MKTLIKTVIAVAFCFSALTCAADAEDFSFRLSANQKSIDSALDCVFEAWDAKLMTGISGLYDSNDLRLLFINGMIVNGILTDGLTGGLGFKGVGGEAEKHRVDGDVLNLGFMAYILYDLTKTEFKQYPFNFSASICLAPEPLSFSDTTEFAEFTAECAWKILDNAAAVVNYRYIEIDFDNTRQDWEKSNSAAYLGLKFFF